ncbi:MAG: hypothetical protein BWY85_00279 [Firmicutes bacterium ADurb.Bin506]|nr:MAG: hypothetical protein BWY85_00279 [Firmicutes bacterium ADurb.Bin506]
MNKLGDLFLVGLFIVAIIFAAAGWKQTTTAADEHPGSISGPSVTIKAPAHRETDGPTPDGDETPEHYGSQEIAYYSTPTAATTPEPTPEQTPAPPYGEAEVELIAKVIWAEARGIKSDAEKAAVAWCILNRYDAGTYGQTIIDVITAPHQFAYREGNPATDELKALAADVLGRWWAEKNGQPNAGRTLPAEYYFFEGDGAHNHYRQQYAHTGETWDWSLPDPYAEKGDEE